MTVMDNLPVGFPEDIAERIVAGFRGRLRVIAD
jgi:hypothetical protein